MWKLEVIASIELRKAYSPTRSLTAYTSRTLQRKKAKNVTNRQI